MLSIDSQGKGSFTYAEDTITAHWEPGSTGPAHYLNGIGLAVWLEQHRVPCFHANVLEFGHSAFGLIGGSTVGKSTLTTHLLTRSHTFLSDDMLALHEAKDGYLAYPGEPKLKLWPDTIEACGLGTADHWPKIHHQYDKRVVAIENFPGAAVCPEPKPLQTLYLLERGGPDDKEPVLQLLEPAKSLMAMVTHSAAMDVPSVLGLEAERFKTLGRLVRQIPVKQLLIPSDVACMLSVCEIIENDLTNS